MSGWLPDWPDGELANGREPEPSALDDLLAEQLLDGTESDSVPSNHRLLADVLAAARAPTLESELTGEADAVSVFRLATPSGRDGVRSMRALLLAGGLAIATAGGAAIATGSLPDTAQDVAWSMLSKIGIKVPRGHRATPPQDTGLRRQPGVPRH